MDEFNLASRFAEDEDEAPRRGRGKLKRLRRGKTGVGMEKPEGHDRRIVPGEASAVKTEEGPDDMNMRPGVDEMSEIDSPRLGGAFDLPEPGEDEAFDDLVGRMEGESASAGRARAKRSKLKGRRPAPRFRDEDEEE